MTATKTFLTLALALFLLATASASCFRKCRFTFCDGRHTFKVGVPDRPFTGAICMRGKKVGVIGSTFESYVVLGRRKVRISKWWPSGLKQRFSPSFFKTYTIYPRVHKRRPYRSGVGHEVPQQNQVDFLNRRCFILPIAAFQVLDRKGNVIDNVHPRGMPFRACVSFTTKLPYWE